MKEKRYKKVKNAIIAGASSGIVAGMILMGTSNVAFAETADLNVPAYTQNANDTGMHMMRRWNSPKGMNTLAGTLGLSRDEIKQELKSGKTMKQIMQEHGIDTTQLNKNFRSGRIAKNHNMNI